MSAIECPVCGHLRKIEQISTPEGWINPQCYSCGDPGWTQPYGEDDPFAGRGVRITVNPALLDYETSGGRPTRRWWQLW